jgi:hypothetical protein
MRQGVLLASTCLNNGARGAWQQTRCGDGRVDPSEQCDPGLGTDSCCTATCQLAAGCSCANSAGCCAGGRVADAGVTCRSARNGCDLAELCDGLSGTCPADSYAAPGVACGDGGTCYQGECASRDALCQSLYPGQAVGACTMPVSTSCAATGLSCNFGTACFSYPDAVPDGYGCGAGNQCLNASCVASSALSDYHWDVGAFGACTNNLESRLVRCVDETGAAVSDALCQAPKPDAVLNCP